MNKCPLSCGADVDYDYFEITSFEMTPEEYYLSATISILIFLICMRNDLGCMEFAGGYPGTCTKRKWDIVTKELLTPKGIRSLSPKSGGYNPNYVGPQIQRDYAYHQGTAWPWLMGFYLEAYLRIYKMSGLSFVERQLISYDDEMTSHCVGSIPELFDGNPPFKGRGAVSFAMNVAEILRVLKLLSKYY